MILDQRFRHELVAAVTESWQWQRRIVDPLGIGAAVYGSAAAENHSGRVSLAAQAVQQRNGSVQIYLSAELVVVLRGAPRHAGEVKNERHLIL